MTHQLEMQVLGHESAMDATFILFTVIKPMLHILDIPEIKGYLHGVMLYFCDTYHNSCICIFQ